MYYFYFRRQTIPGATTITVVIPEDTLCCTATKKTLCSCASVNVRKFQLNNLELLKFLKFALSLP